MKRVLASSVVLGSLAIIAAVFSSHAIAEEPRSAQRAVDEVRRLSAQEVEAFLHRDETSMARLWSNDFVVTNPLNRLANKQQVLGMMSSGFLVITSYDRQTEFARLYRDDTVVLAGSETVVWGGKMPNAGRTERLRFTAIWMREGGEWREVARHANIVPQP
jgi:uncharacterized protein (TIGR02246 family)